MSSATFCPREPVCAVAYSQLRWELTSSLHCCSGGCPESMAQNDVTVFCPTSFRPARSPAACALCSSAYVHAWVPEKLVLQAALAPGSPSVRL